MRAHFPVSTDTPSVGPKRNERKATDGRRGSRVCKRPPYRGFPAHSPGGARPTPDRRADSRPGGRRIVRPSWGSSVSSARAPERRADTTISASQKDSWCCSSRAEAATRSSTSGRWSGHARYGGDDVRARPPGQRPAELASHGHVELLEDLGAHPARFGLPEGQQTISCHIVLVAGIQVVHRRRARWYPRRSAHRSWMASRSGRGPPPEVEALTQVRQSELLGPLGTRRPRPPTCRSPGRRAC